MKEITGRHVFGIFVTGFGIIIAVNMTLAWNAVQTFPGLEVKNSYVASQSYQKDRAAQVALNWDVSAELKGSTLFVSFSQNGVSIKPVIETTIFGRATTVVSDQTPDFVFDGTSFVAAVNASSGNWNLRIVARSEDGKQFKQRIVVKNAS